MASIFTRIIQGEIPAHIVYDTEDVIAFLDIQPLATGHTLVCPKREVVLLEDLSPDEACAWICAVQTLAPPILRAVDASGYHLRLNNGKAARQEVPHVHMHIIPRKDEVNPQKLPTTGSNPSPEELKMVVEKIRSQF